MRTLYLPGSFEKYNPQYFFYFPQQGYVRKLEAKVDAGGSELCGQISSVEPEPFQTSARFKITTSFSTLVTDKNARTRPVTRAHVAWNLERATWESSVKLKTANGETDLPLIAHHLLSGGTRPSKMKGKPLNMSTAKRDFVRASANRYSNQCSSFNSCCQEVVDKEFVLPGQADSHTFYLHVP